MTHDTSHVVQGYNVGQWKKRSVTYSSSSLLSFEMLKFVFLGYIDISNELLIVNTKWEHSSYKTYLEVVHVQRLIVKWL